jgi:hypothetical protein
MATREELEAHSSIDGQHGWITVRLDVPVMRGAYDVIVDVPEGSKNLADKSIATINDILALGDDAGKMIIQLLFDDAARARQNVAFGDSQRMGGVRQSESHGFWSRLAKPHRRPKFDFIAIDPTDLRHPCFFAEGLASVDGKIKWVSAHICEEDDTPHRYARLFCYPAWETEHGICVAIRDGVPVGLVDFQDVFDPLGESANGR